MTDRKWWDLWWDWRVALEPPLLGPPLERSAARGGRARDLLLGFVDSVRDEAQCCTSKLISNSDAPSLLRNKKPRVILSQKVQL